MLFPIPRIPLLIRVLAGHRKGMLITGILLTLEAVASGEQASFYAAEMKMYTVFTFPANAEN